MRNPHIIQCLSCRSEVLPRSDGRCPACQAVIEESDPAGVPGAAPAADVSEVSFKRTGNAASGAPPVIFYQAARTYRNAATITALFSSLLTSCPFLDAIIRHWSNLPVRFLPMPVAYLGAAILLNLAARLCYRVIHNVRDPVEINSEGIRSRHNFWYWPQIESIGTLLLSSKHTYRIKVGLRIDPRTSFLVADTPLCRDQNDAIIDKLKPFLATRHPTIRLNYVHG